jgi:asparagine synthase (glutamine-hydrolysing)
MCGIVGLYHFHESRPVRPETVMLMCDSIRHRGPDDEGIFVEGPVALGMRRLSIIDLSSGHQPIFSEDGTLLIVFNGEIYNYRELRKDLEGHGHVFSTESDTETILHAYEQYGPECTLKLNGMFAFAVFERGARTLFLARDHVGVKPLYYCVADETLLFASEIKSLLVHACVEREVDEDALLEYMTYGYVSGDRTLFRGIRKLPAGHSMTVKRADLKVRQYWKFPRPSVATEKDPGQSHYAAQLSEALKKAVKRQMVSDVPLGAFLSGGIDSSSIVHLMRHFSNGPVNTYAIGFGSRHAFHDELDDARNMAQFAETKHHEIIAEPNVVDLIPRLVWHLDEPVADSSYIVTYLVSQLAAQSVKVILSGVGGDELFGGYRRYLGFSLNRYLRAVPETLRKALQRFLLHLPGSRDNGLSNLVRLARAFLLSLDRTDLEQYRTLLSSPIHQVLPGGVLANGDLKLTFAMPLFLGEFATGDLLQKMQSYDFRHSLVDDLLLLTDKMSMACSLESRVPLLDIELIEMAATIPSKYKLNGLNLRSVQKAAMKHSLPAAILRKKKKGFGCPIGAWVKNELRDYIQDCLCPSRLNRHGLFNGIGVSRMLQEHYASKADHTDLLMTLLTFEVWYDTFISSRKIQPVTA